MGNSIIIMNIRLSIDMIQLCRHTKFFLRSLFIIYSIFFGHICMYFDPCATVMLILKAAKERQDLLIDATREQTNNCNSKYVQFSVQ